MVLNEQEQEIWRRGSAAAGLLASEDFREVIRSLTIESFAVFTETEPHQASEREASYNLARALQAIEAELNARVQAKDEIERKAQEEHDDEFPPETEGPDVITIQGD